MTFSEDMPIKTQMQLYEQKLKPFLLWFELIQNIGQVQYFIVGRKSTLQIVENKIKLSTFYVV